MKISNTYINGLFVDESNNDHFDLLNPADESKLGSLICSNKNQVNSAIDAALANEKLASSLTKEQRILILQEILDGVILRSEDLAAAIS